MEAPGYPVTAHLVVTGPGGGLLLLESAANPGRWQLPGGLVEAGEPPSRAAEREAQEETGLHIEAGPLLVVSWIEARTPGRRDRLVLIFEGPTLSAPDLSQIRLQETEVRGWRIADHATAAKLMHPLMADRLPAIAQRSGTACYMEQPTVRA